MPEPVCPRCAGPLPGQVDRCPHCAVPLPKGLAPITIAADSVKVVAAPHADRRLSRLPTLQDRPEPVGISVRTRNLAPPADAQGADYELTGTVGEGGMGVVWEARQLGLGRTVALKRLRPGRESMGPQLLAEATLAGELEHPGIVPVHEVGVDQEGIPFYTMRRINGRTWMERWPGMSLDEHLQILLRVCDAVAYAHSRGIVHRDIKPANVVLGDFGEVVLVDWGLAARIVDLHATSGRGTAAGTPAYMAPEMARADLAQVGECSDLYLLGATLHEILTGEAPHPGESPIEILVSAADNRIEPAIPAGELGDICRQAMDPDPARRHAEVRLFRDDIRRHLAHVESQDVASRAQIRLRRAQTVGGTYDDFARAMHGFEDALEQWPENPSARLGLAEARLALAAKAREAGDLDLAESVLTSTQADHLPELVRIAAARNRRKARQRRLRLLAWTSAALLVVVFGVIAAGFLAVRHQRDLVIRVAQERDEAESRLAAEEASRADHRAWRRVFFEDFHRGMLPPELRLAAGAWRIESTTLKALPPDPLALVVPVAVRADVRVQVDLHHGGELAVLLGVTENEAARRLASTGTVVEVGERMRVRRASVILADQPMPESSPDLPRRIRIGFERGELRVEVDGQEILSRLAVGPSTARQPVLGLVLSPGGIIDNLRVEIPEEPPAPVSP